MAEVLFWAAVQQDLVPARQVDFLWTPGDVIAVRRDGWPWGRMELGNPLWRIWRLPGLPADCLQDLVEDESNQIGGQSFRVRTRVRYLDISSTRARALLMRGAFLDLDSEDVKRVLSWKRTKQVLGQVG